MPSDDQWCPCTVLILDDGTLSRHKRSWHDIAPYLSADPDFSRAVVTQPYPDEETARRFWPPAPSII